MSVYTFRRYNLKCAVCGSGFTCGQPKRAACDSCRTRLCGCGNRFTARLSRRFCSIQCYLKHHAVPMLTCEWCKNEFPKRRGRVMKHCSQECRYQAARKPEAAKHRGHDYRRWATAVYERDGFACRQCGSTGAIHAHHVKEWSEFPELRFKVSNGLTVCQDCHQIIHGRKMTQASKRFQPVCISCDVKTKGHSQYCRSCAIRLQKRTRRAALLTNQGTHLTSSEV
jgi:hypothetical protein